MDIRALVSVCAVQVHWEMAIVLYLVKFTLNANVFFVFSFPS